MAVYVYVNYTQIVNVVDNRYKLDRMSGSSSLQFVERQPLTVGEDVN